MYAALFDALAPEPLTRARRMYISGDAPGVRDTTLGEAVHTGSLAEFAEYLEQRR